MKYRICRTCKIPHYENCHTCYGFGVYQSTRGNGLIPISASEAHVGRPPGKPEKCPECGSSLGGVPR